MQSETIMHRIIREYIYFSYAILRNPTYRMLKIMAQYSSDVIWIKSRIGCKELVACYGQGFGKEIRVIAEARDEHGAEVTLFDPIPDPMPAHVNRL